jgi:hypothetical protein
MQAIYGDMRKALLDTAANQEIRRQRYRAKDEVARWNESISFAENATVLPQTFRSTQHDLVELRRPVLEIYDGGVYDSAGAIIEVAMHAGHLEIRHIPAVSSTTNMPIEWLAGSWLFGGFLRVDFGHFLTESLGRLWALDNLREPVAGVVFINMNGRPRHGDHFEPEVIEKASHHAISGFPFISEVFEILQLPKPVRVVGMPVKVERLIIPSQLMGLSAKNDLIGGHPTFRHFIERRFTPEVVRPRNRRIYVSRARLDPKSSFFFQEALLESNLQREGYEIIYPESMTIRAQVETFAAASHVVLATGSASHLLALCLGNSQRVALLHRHRKAWPGFAPQLRLMGASSVIEIDATNGVFVPRSEADKERLQVPTARLVHSLDFRKLWSALQKGGLVSSLNSFVGEEATTDEILTMEIRLAQAYHEIEFKYVLAAS